MPCYFPEGADDHGHCECWSEDNAACCWCGYDQDEADICPVEGGQ